MPTLSDWFQTPKGEYILAWEQTQYDNAVEDVFGFNATQVGLPAVDFLRKSRIPLRFALEDERGGDRGAGRGAPLVADPAHLPLATHSIDLLVLPHVLEFSANPHQILREASRILMPEGHVVLSGFNPWSLWGARRLAVRRDGDPPWAGQFINLPRLKDWMALLGFELAAGRMCCYAPPLTSEKWLRRFGFMESAGDRWWPFAGGIYFLHGIKRVQGMRIITPKWKTEQAPQKALAPLPHKTSPDDAMAARNRLDRK